MLFGRYGVVLQPRHEVLNGPRAKLLDYRCWTLKGAQRLAEDFNRVHRRAGMNMDMVYLAVFRQVAEREIREAKTAFYGTTAA